MAEEQRGPHVGLFVTCLVDLFRPSVGFAAVKLLEDVGCRVAVPAAQTCCGQPAYNSGDRRDAMALAKQTIAAFEPYDYVVAPSGSCAGMLKVHYPGLLAGEQGWGERTQAFADKVHEIVSFLVDVRGVEGVKAAFAGTVTYHDSCSSLREMGVRDQARRLLKSVDGLTLAEMDNTEACCGFGGTFCIKYPDISNEMVERKTAAIAASGAGMVLAGDLGCLLNIAGKLKRQGYAVASRHVAEVLAGMTAAAPIGEAKED